MAALTGNGLMTLLAKNSSGSESLPGLAAPLASRAGCACMGASVRAYASIMKQQGTSLCGMSLCGMLCDTLHGGWGWGRRPNE